MLQDHHRVSRNSMVEYDSCDVRVVRNLISSNIPIRDERIVCVVERCEVCHLRLASVGVLAMRQELVHSIESV